MKSLTIRPAEPLRRIATAGFLLLSILAGGAAADTPADSSFRLAQEGYQYQFPRDHGTHDSFRTEWWYYTGHLETAEGRRFGFELTFFRRGVPPDQVETHPSRWSVDQLYLAHLAVTDVTGRRFYFRDRISRAGLGKAGADRSEEHTSELQSH